MYAVILFPGVLIHELSHWITAKLLGVRTGSFSIIPRQNADGTIQLGYVEYYRGKTLDPIRESLIGGAPLIVGTTIILLIGFNVFDVSGLAGAVQSGDLDTLSFALASLYQTDFILFWVYLIFAISNAMLPSKSDRRAWPAFVVAMILLAGIVYLLDLQQEVAAGLAQPVVRVFGYLGIAFSIAIGADLFFMLVVTLVETIAGRIRGVKVVYGRTENEQT
ncbi:MAG: hypothetical protein R3293_28765 [Candidatus Promineifilaceae bacterium]|nr:hypothetical protein [Candidatus Promineifilaceae bacterium]